MARYTQGSKWWEITLSKTTVSTKWGKGGSTSMREKEHADAAAAQKDYDKQIADHEKQGFTLDGAKPAKKPAKGAKVEPAAKKPAKGNKDLEKAIIADPNDPEPYLVYADYLNEAGDPHGEVIVMHHRKAAEATGRLKSYASALKKAMAWPAPETFKLEWQFGFIKSATIGWEASAEEIAPSGDDDEDDRDFETVCKTLLVGFLRDPRARFIQELTLGPVPGQDYMSADKLAVAIDEVTLPCLRSFEMSEHGFWDLSSTSAQLPKSSSTPALRDFVIHAGQLCVPKDIHWPHLTSATFRTGSLAKGALKNIVNAKWPNLETLEIWFGEPRYGGDCNVKGVAPIFAGTGLGKLKHLKLMNCAFADDVAKALVKSKILAQLETLDLSMGNLSDAGVAAMAAAKDKFKHLKELDVEDNAMTDASVPLLRGLAKKVKNSTRHETERAASRPEDNKWGHFVSVGE